MKNKLTEQVEQTLADLSKNTAIPAGQTASERQLPDPQLVDAIGQLFAEFELVYHNQYNKAFGTAEKLNYAKRLWYSHLKLYSAETIISAAKVATRESEYLPTVHTMVRACDELLQEAGVPTPSMAYREACMATAPKVAYEWSHPIVYLAGKDTGWQYLHETPERIAFSVFSEHYVRWRTRWQAGESIDIPKLESKTPTKSSKPLEKSSQQARLKSLRKELGL